MGKQVLVVAAHPDDEILGCGATIACHAAKGDKVHLLILGEGITSRSTSQKTISKNERAKNRLYTHSRNAAKLVGAQPPEFVRLPDNRFDTVALLDIVKAIEQVIARVKPVIIYTHHGGDLNVDHRRTLEAVLAATRPQKNTSVLDLYAFYIPSSSEWSFGRVSKTFTPNVFLDVTSTMNRKIKALESYKSEMRPFPHPRSIKAIHAQSLSWGAMVGVRNAEIFELIRSVRKQDN